MGRGSSILPGLEPSVSTMERVVEFLAPTFENSPPKDKGSVMGIRIPEDFYRTNGQEVTKEEWLDYRQRLEEDIRREEQKDKGNMNNEENRERQTHPNDREEGVGENGND